jgi:hypothetical protein
MSDDMIRQLLEEQIESARTIYRMYMSRVRKENDMESDTTDSSEDSTVTVLKDTTSTVTSSAVQDESSSSSE